MFVFCQTNGLLINSPFILICISEAFAKDDVGYCNRWKAQCPLNRNNRSAEYEMLPEDKMIQWQKCMMFCRNKLSFYFTIDSSKCQCFDTCYNMTFVETGSSYYTWNSEYNFDPNRICPRGYLQRSYSTCPQDINVLQKGYKTIPNDMKRSEILCFNQCKEVRSANYYEFNTNYCYCFSACNGMKGTGYQSTVGLLYKGYDPSLISVDR